MTPADKLRELLASRPAQPTLEELVRWWRSSVELLPRMLNELADVEIAVDAYKTAFEPAFDEIAKLCGCPQWDYPGQLIRDVQNVVQERDNLRKDLDDARAKLRREQDARAELRLELDAWLKAGQDVVNLFDPMSHRAAPHTMLLVARAAEAAHKMVRQERDQIRAEVARQLAAVDVLKQEVRELEQQRDQLRGELERPSFAGTGHPDSWLDCAACRARSKSGAEPPRCEEFLALEAARAERERMEAGHA